MIGGLTTNKLILIELFIFAFRWPGGFPAIRRPGILHAGCSCVKKMNVENVNILNMKGGG
jgi:hypothetical protein